MFGSRGDGIAGTIAGVLLLLAAWLALSGTAVAGSTTAFAEDICPRPVPGSAVGEPEELRSQRGVLKLDMTLRNVREKDGTTRYCYLLGDGAESPTLRLKPGDELILTLKNQLVDSDGSLHPGLMMPMRMHGRVGMDLLISTLPRHRRKIPAPAVP